MLYIIKKMEVTNNLSPQEYDDEPVFYCKNCMSLRIKNIGGILDYCDDCGSTDIGIINIHIWEKLYIKRYGIKFLKK